MSSRRIAFGRQVNRREIARTPREARANMEVVDLAAKRRRQREELVAEATKAAETAEEAQADPAGSLPQQETENQSKAKKVTSTLVRIRYNGRASRFRIAGYAFKPGEVIPVTEVASLEILTYPYENFTLVKE